MPGEPEAALDYFGKALDTPRNLGEAYHLLQTRADVNYWMGKALRGLGRMPEANEAFERSAKESNDFQNSAVVAFSEASYFKGLSLIELGRFDEAKRLFEGIVEYASQGIPEDPRIPYFATSLPKLLVFNEDLQKTEEDRLARLRELGENGLAACRSTKEKV